LTDKFAARLDIRSAELLRSTAGAEGRFASHARQLPQTKKIVQPLSLLGDSMKILIKTMSAAAIGCITLGSSLAMAQSVPDHPRVNEVNQRLDNQQSRINQGLANGTMSNKQAARDEKHDANIAKRESADEAKHNGHLTKGEQNRLNRSENRNSRRIHRQKH
jgi:hypothetical protein